MASMKVSYYVARRRHGMDHQAVAVRWLLFQPGHNSPTSPRRHEVPWRITDTVALAPE